MASGEIALANLKITLNQVAALFGGIHLHVSCRVAHRMEAVVQYLALSGSLWECLIDLNPQLSAKLVYSRFMTIQIGGKLTQLVNLMAQILNHDFQVLYMIIGKAQNLLILFHLNIALLHLFLKLVDPLSGLIQFLFLGL